MKYVKTSMLAPGAITASNLYNAENRLMLAANTVLTEGLIRSIGNLGFHGVYVLHDAGDASYEPLLDDAFRNDAIKTLKSLNIDQIRYVANSIANNIIYGSERLYDMMTVSAYDDLTYMHSVNVTVLSVMMGVAMGLDNAKLKELGQSALFHDVGKTKVDPAIIKKPGRLTAEEFAQVKRHPVYGYELLGGSPDVPEIVRMSVLCHHENEDGTGYPAGVRGPNIPLYAKIIHVADVYDAMVSKRVYKERMNPADVLEHLMGGAGSTFDLRCVRALQSSVALYPNGVKVRLSNGISAWVQENHRGYPARPVVMTDGGTRIDLMTALNVTVTAILEG